MNLSKTLFIINPASHGGIGLNAWKQFQKQWLNQIDPQETVITQRPGHAREITISADGYDVIVAVGGDGTVREVISGIMDRKNPDLKLAIVPGGTGNDIGLNIGIKSVEQAVDALHKGHTQAFDIMRVDSQINGRSMSTYGFLSTALGFSAISMIRPWMKRILGPKGAYYFATILQIICYRPTRMILRAKDIKHDGKTWLILVGNAESLAGGSMRIAPGARTDDGELNISIFSKGSKIPMAYRIMAKIASGEHVKEPEVLYFPAKRIEVDSIPPAVVEVDGDLYGNTPATIQVYPRAMQIIVPAIQGKKV